MASLTTAKKTNTETSLQTNEHVGYPIEALIDCSNKPEATNTAFFTYGRFQPGHTGHKIMIEKLLEIALQHNIQTKTQITHEKTNVYVFVSPSGGPTEKNPKKNPLTPDEKVHLLQQQYAGYPIHFINMRSPLPENIPTSAFGALALLGKTNGIGCYDQTVMLIGEDRIKFAQQLEKYGLTAFEFAPRSEGAMSATELRTAAVENNTDKFNAGIQFGAVTPELADYIKKVIRSKHGLQGGKKRRRKTRIKRRRKTKRKTKRRKTKTKRKRKKRTLRRYTIRRRKK